MPALPSRSPFQRGVDDALVKVVGSYLVVAIRFLPDVTVIGPSGRVTATLRHPEYRQPRWGLPRRWRSSQERFRNWAIKQSFLQRVMALNDTVFAVRVSFPVDGNRSGNAMILMSVAGEQLAATNGEPQLLTWVDGDFACSISTDEDGGHTLVRFLINSDVLLQVRGNARSGSARRPIVRRD